MSSKHVMSEEEKKALQFAQIEWPEADVAYLFGRIGDKTFFHIYNSARHGYVGKSWYVGEKNGSYWWLDNDEMYLMCGIINSARKE